MSATHVNKHVRKLFEAALLASPATILIGVDTVPVALLDRAPAGLKIPEDKLPAIYVYASGEQVRSDGLQTHERNLQIDVILLARDGVDPRDQLDDLQLLVETRILAASDLNALCLSVDLLGASLASDQGRVIFGARTLSYAVVFHVTASDPSV
ncbi:hypothetical protein [Falsihalocynthiibacter sp. CO-5D18]|uniref:hypothetical protein n=1 Tax=Falsihalocynthiibacter sp. CO-5D18 TaxID=3240872 RepID=UPI003510CE38